MKNYLLGFLAVGALTFVGCKEEEKVDPIIGLWELDDASMKINSSGFSYYDFDGENNIYGESSYTIEFFDDFTFEREINDVFTGIAYEDLNEEGEWEKKNGALDLDSEDDEIGGLPYSFEIIELTDRTLTLEYEDTRYAFPNAKIDDWFNDGTLNSAGSFTVTEEEYDSLVENFRVLVDATFTLEFDKD